ncbi:MAG: DnaJ C-terminal domain-containing protein [Rubrivivax sp.]
MQYKDYYQVLGVARDANADEVKRAFRRLARKYHPDVSKEADAQERMREVNEANAVLSDPERRAAYDALGSGHRSGERFTPPPDWDAGFEFSGGGRGADAGAAPDFSDFFGELFGRPGRTGRGAPRPAAHGPLRGEDHHAAVVLDLEDAWRGATRQLSLQSPEFDGDGRLRMRSRTLDVRIPAGVRPGQLIRLAGQGSPGHAGGPAGDLLLEVRLRPHPRFRVDGGDLIASLPVAPWEAALGAVVPVALPDGSTMKVRVPKGAQSGRVLSVRGRGLPGKLAGDLELQVQVVLPSADDPRARRHYEAMAAELPEFDARAQAEADRSSAPDASAEETGR